MNLPIAIHSVLIDNFMSYQYAQYQSEHSRNIIIIHMYIRQYLCTLICCGPLPKRLSYIFITILHHRISSISYAILYALLFQFHLGNYSFTGHCGQLSGSSSISIHLPLMILKFGWVRFNESSFSELEIGWSSTGSDRSQPVYKYKLSSIELTYHGNRETNKSLIPVITSNILYLHTWHIKMERKIFVLIV